MLLPAFVLVVMLVSGLEVPGTVEGKNTCPQCPSCLSQTVACLDVRHRLRSHPDFGRSGFAARDVYFCPVADMWFTYPPPTNEELRKLYASHYNRGTGVNGPNNPRPVGQFAFVTGAVNLTSHLHRVDTTSSSARLIVESGCSGGYLLGKFAHLLPLFSNASTDNGKLLCFEPTPTNYANGEKYLRTLRVPYQIIPSIMNASSLESNTVDMFLSSHVLEHMAEPCAFVAELYRCMKPGGLVFIEVPNHSEEFLRHSNSAFKLHLNFPTPRGLLMLLESAGFKLVSMQTGGDGTGGVVVQPVTLFGTHAIRSLWVKPHHHSWEDRSSWR